ncbi:hypothetical protein AVEN_132476-1 [Araneus ventricosus]|uniref:Uncharacterized protein n=1 Tax=Araneus ventricosus TaxID=182803 RepID=A0A4Y2FZP8_ARAVE|nr:hypothetical protein AVEN_132476-1 [Araneus ventricosus]
MGYSIWSPSIVFELQRTILAILIKCCWIPGHSGIPGKENWDKAVNRKCNSRNVCSFNALLAVKFSTSNMAKNLGRTDKRYKIQSSFKGFGNLAILGNTVILTRLRSGIDRTPPHIPVPDAMTATLPVRWTWDSGIDRTLPHVPVADAMTATVLVGWDNGIDRRTLFSPLLVGSSTEYYPIS